LFSIIGFFCKGQTSTDRCYLDFKEGRAEGGPLVGEFEKLDLSFLHCHTGVLLVINSYLLRSQTTNSQSVNHSIRSGMPKNAVQLDSNSLKQ